MSEQNPEANCSPEQAGLLVDALGRFLDTKGDDYYTKEDAFEGEIDPAELPEPIKTHLPIPEGVQLTEPYYLDAVWYKRQSKRAAHGKFAYLQIGNYYSTDEREFLAYINYEFCRDDNDVVTVARRIENSPQQTDRELKRAFIQSAKAIRALKELEKMDDEEREEFMDEHADEIEGAVEEQDRERKAARAIVDNAMATERALGFTDVDADEARALINLLEKSTHS